MKNKQNALIGELFTELNSFQKMIDEKLKMIVKDSEAVTISCLNASRNITESVSLAKNNIHDIALDEIIKQVFEMQENFQYHDVLRQNIERILNTRSLHNQLIIRLLDALDSTEDVIEILKELKEVNQKYKDFDSKHVSSLKNDPAILDSSYDMF